MLHKPRCDRMISRYTARDASLEAELEDSSLLFDRLNSSFSSTVPLTVSYCRPLGYCLVLPKSDNSPHQCHYRRFLVALDDDALVSQLADVLDDLLSHPLDVPPLGRHHVREQRLALSVAHRRDWGRAFYSWFAKEEEVQGHHGHGDFGFP